tara:strand:+ start:365 stop:532 length:168 start_codon:yes stop_codon:yes gene_type:complete
MTYKLVNDYETGNLCSIKHTDSNGNISLIPIDDANRHYQEYLSWVAEGNTAQPAD